jgi:uncharacterized repeat protein (TIGR01451 family)
VNSVLPYSTPYAGATTAPFYSGGGTVYLRAVVSDPFGSYDINANAPGTLPTITIKDPGNNTMIGPVAMSQVADSGTLTKTFEYAYTVPAGGPEGFWIASVRAVEGTENNVADTGIGTFRVTLLPNIVMVKSVQPISDPYNGGANPKAIPGAVMLYSVGVTNQGLGSASSVVVSDPVPPDTMLFVNDLGLPGSGPVAFIDGAASSGLSYSFLGLGSGADNIAFSNDNGATWTYTPVPDGSGYDSAVTNIQVSLGGTLAAASGPNQPSFTLRFEVKVK